MIRAGGTLAWQSGSSILVYALLYGLLAAFVVMPPLLGLLSELGQFDGNSIVGNYTILPWVLSGRGVVWGLLLLSSSLFLLVLFLAGLFLLFALRDEPGVLRRICMRELWKRLPEVLWISVRWSLVVVAAVLVLGLVPGLGFLVFLSEYDINYYLKSQPAEWWIVIGISAVWIVGVGSVLVRALLRISLLFPLWVRRPVGLRTCARESWGLTRGHAHRLGLLALVSISLVLLVHLLLNLAIFRTMEALLPLAAGSLRGSLAVIGGGLLVLVLESFAALCAGVAWICAIWSLYCDGLAPAPAGEVKAAAAPGKRGTKPLRALVLAGGCAALVVFILHVAVKLPQQVSQPRTIVIAHRGGAGEAPENSAEAFRLAVSNGCSDMVEMDVALTADGVLILAHDSDLMRQADEPRKLADMGWDEMSGLTLKTPQSHGNQLAPVARLEEVLREISNQCPVIVEFKHSKLTTNLVSATVAAVQELGLMENALFMSLDLVDVQGVQALAPGAKVGYFVSVEMGNFLELQLNCIAPRHTLVTRKIVADARARGMPVFAWTVDDPVRIVQLLELGVDGIITNEPSRVRKLVDAYFMIPAEFRSLLRFRSLWDFLLERQEFQSLADMAGEEIQD
jgi:glycerophosphoryl diester phosphodiesterase